MTEMLFDTIKNAIIEKIMKNEAFTPVTEQKILYNESNQNVFLIQIYASSFAEFEISELEISRVDCIAYEVMG